MELRGLRITKARKKVGVRAVGRATAFGKVWIARSCGGAQFDFWSKMGKLTFLTNFVRDLVNVSSFY